MLTRKLASHPDRVIALARRAYTAASRPREARQRDRCGAHSLPPRTSSCPAPSCGSSHRVDLTLEPVDQVAAVAFVEEQKLAAWGEEVAAILTRRRPRLLVVLIKVMAPGGQSRGCRCSRVPLRGGGGRAAAWPVAGDADLRVGPLLPRTGVLRSAVSRARAWPSGPRRARTRRSRRVRRGPLLADALLPGRRHVSLALAWTISRSCSLDVAQVDLADGGVARRGAQQVGAFRPQLHRSAATNQRSSVSCSLWLRRSAARDSSPPRHYSLERSASTWTKHLTTTTRRLRFGTAEETCERIAAMADAHRRTPSVGARFIPSG